MSMKQVLPPPETGSACACSTVAAAGHWVYESSVWKNSKRPGRRLSPPREKSPSCARSSSESTNPESMICRSSP